MSATRHGISASCADRAELQGTWGKNLLESQIPPLIIPRRHTLVLPLLARRKRQGRGQLERQCRLGRDLNLLVPGHCPSHQSGTCAHKSTNASSFSSAGYAANQCAPCCSSTRRGSGPLALPFDGGVQWASLDRIGFPLHCNAHECEAQFSLTLELALRFRVHHRATDGCSSRNRCPTSNTHRLRHCGEKRLARLAGFGAQRLAHSDGKRSSCGHNNRLRLRLLHRRRRRGWRQGSLCCLRLDRGLVVNASSSRFIAGDLLQLLLCRRCLNLTAQRDFPFLGRYCNIGVLRFRVSGSLCLNVFLDLFVFSAASTADHHPKQ